MRHCKLYSRIGKDKASKDSIEKKLETSGFGNTRYKPSRMEGILG